MKLNKKKHVEMYKLVNQMKIYLKGLQSTCDLTDSERILWVKSSGNGLDEKYKSHVKALWKTISVHSKYNFFLLKELQWRYFVHVTNVTHKLQDIK